MSNNKILDDILHCYLYAEKLRLEKSSNYQKMTFDFILSAQLKGESLNVEEWHKEFLKQTLLNNVFLELPSIGSEPYIITKAGIKAAQTGWYKKVARDNEIEDEIRQLTLTDLKRSKRNFVIAVLSLIVSTLISIYTLFITPNNVEKKEVDTLKIELEKLQNEINKINK